MYPPTSSVDILWWDETTFDNPLRVGTIIEEGNDTHAYKIQFRDGTTRYPTLREMDSRCIAHNKLVASDNELVVTRIQIALQEEVAFQLAELTAHVRAGNFQEARDQMISLSKQSKIHSSPSKALPETSSVGPQQEKGSCDHSMTTPLPEMTSPSSNVENEKSSNDDVGVEAGLSPETSFVDPIQELGPNNPSTATSLPQKNGVNEKTGSEAVDNESEVSPTASSVEDMPNPPAPPLSSSTQMPKELGVFTVTPTTIQEARNQMKCLQMFEKNLKKQKREEDEAELRTVRKLKKELVEAKMEAKRIKLEKEKQALTAPEVTNDDGWDGLGDLYSKQTRKKSTRLDAWQNGNKYARQEKDKWLHLTTVDSLGEVIAPLTKYGFCILNNFTNGLDEDCQPTAEQRDYIRKVPSVDTDILFEGAQLSDVLGYTNLVWPTETKVGVRVQLKKSGHSGKWGPTYVAYKRKYKGQLDNIIKGMFPQNEEAGDPNNWKMDFNSIMGGQGYQHPHSDHARAGTYKSLKIFPFVAIHGFNLDPFSLWLLPPNSDYGFLHTCEPHQMLFMRGDQVHAGVPSATPRGHMEFFPLPAAGYERQNPYWCRNAYKQETFAYQNPCIFPFGYPDVSTPNIKGEQLIRYPVEVTRLLQLPLKKEGTAPGEKQVRIAMKKRMAAQLTLC
jgi:hypothetical protein